MQTTTTKLHNLFSGKVVPLAWSAKVSFDKQSSSNVKWFTLGESVLDGPDMLASLDDNPIQLWDTYDYTNIDSRVISMDFTRSLEFPFNVQSSVADVSLNNYDNFFSLDKVLPKRPLRLYMGTGSTKLPVFVGLTQDLPNYSEDGLQMNWTAIDFLSEIADQGLRESIKMRNVRTDQVIATILEQYGMVSGQYNLAPGQNVIPFVIFNKGDNAGDALKKLVQAENGALWLDEQGIIRFTNRTGVLGKEPVMVFDDSNIINIKPSRTGGIVNRVKITSELRVVQNKQSIFSMENERGHQSGENEDSWRIPANGSMSIWLSLSDPAWAADDLVLNGPKNSSWFTAKNLSGNRVNSGITNSGVLFQDSYKLTINNSNLFAVSIDRLELWGEPAKVVDVIGYEALDTESQEKFGDLPVEISDNNFFGSYINCDLFAVDTLTKQSEYSPILELNVKGDVSLQISDVISVDYSNYSGDYIIIGIQTKMTKGLLETNLKCRKHTVVYPFTLDKSKLDGADILG